MLQTLQFPQKRGRRERNKREGKGKNFLVKIFVVTGLVQSDLFYVDTSPPRDTQQSVSPNLQVRVTLHPPVISVSRSHQL